MRYVSTRGEAAPLDFVEVMLAGLARDGGLYVPETWPAVMNDAIAGLAGKPYAEVALEVIRPFAGGSVADADLARMAREAYGTFRHPAVTPLVQLAPNLFVLELFQLLLRGAEFPFHILTLPGTGHRGRGHFKLGVADFNVMRVLGCGWHCREGGDAGQHRFSTRSCAGIPEKSSRSLKHSGQSGKRTAA